MFVFPPLLMTQDYFDRRNEAKSQLPLTKATVSKVEVVGMGDRVCVDLCSMMRPGEGLLVCVYISLVHCCHALKKKNGDIKMFTIQCDLMGIPFCLIGSVNMWHFVDSCYPYKHTSLHLELHGILFSGWILCKRNVPCSLWMLGNELHCKQAFQGQCGKSKINWMAARYYA